MLAIYKQFLYSDLENDTFVQGNVKKIFSNTLNPKRKRTKLNKQTNVIIKD